MSTPSCATCPHAKPLMFAVYCAQHPELHNLPASIGHMATPPIIQAAPPLWCPLQAMSLEQKITNAFAAKNWQVEDYDYDKQDGYAVEVNTEDYPEIDLLGPPVPAPHSEAQEALIAAYGKAFDEVELAMRGNGNGCTCDGGFILAKTLAQVMEVAALIPDRLSIR